VVPFDVLPQSGLLPAANQYSEGLACVGEMPAAGLWGTQDQIRVGFINRQGAWIIPPTFESCRSVFSEEKAVVCRNMSGWGRNRQCGYINTKGELSIPYRYGYAEPFSEGVAAVKEAEY